MNRKVDCTKVSLFIVVLLVAVIIFAACEEAGAPPSEEIAYTSITEEADLDLMRNNLSGKFRLLNDITLTATNFEPIALDTDPNTTDFQGNAFTGIFDGNGKTISGLAIARPDETHVGFFGQMNGTVRRLRIALTGNDINPSIEGTKYVGAIAGFSGGTIEEVAVTGGYITGTGPIGGLVGKNTGSITMSYMTGGVHGRNSIIGGIVGQNEGSIEQVYSANLTTGSQVAALLVGQNINAGLVTQSYFNSNMGSLGIANDLNSATTDVTGLVPASALLEASFVGWDFAMTWRWVADGEWPVLAWQPSSP